MQASIRKSPFRAESPDEIGLIEGRSVAVARRQNWHCGARQPELRGRLAPTTELRSLLETGPVALPTAFAPGLPVPGPAVRLAYSCSRPRDSAHCSPWSVALRRLRFTAASPREGALWRAEGGVRYPGACASPQRRSRRAATIGLMWSERYPPGAE